MSEVSPNPSIPPLKYYQSVYLLSVLQKRVLILVFISIVLLECVFTLCTSEVSPNPSVRLYSTTRVCTHSLYVRGEF